MLIGYARVSTLEQTLALQQDALTKAGCERTFTDTASGSLAARPGLTEALDFARPGDTLVVWRLDRLGRSLRHLIDTVSLLQERGIGFKSLQEQLDTTTSGGKLVFHVFGALAEFERDLIRERTQAGLLAARARGRLGGRRLIRARCRSPSSSTTTRATRLPTSAGPYASPEPPCTATSRQGQKSRPDMSRTRSSLGSS